MVFIKLINLFLSPSQSFISCENDFKEYNNTIIKQINANNEIARHIFCIPKHFYNQIVFDTKITPSITKSDFEELAKKSKQIIIPEINFSGQYAEIIKSTILEANPECKIIKINSQADLISPERIIKEVKKYV